MSAPVKNTCPDIDKVIRAIKSALKVAKDGRKEHANADDYFHDIYYELDGLEYLLEDLRKANASLREWGDESEQRVAELEQEVIDLESANEIIS